MAVSDTMVIDLRRAGAVRGGLENTFCKERLMLRRLRLVVSLLGLILAVDLSVAQEAEVSQTPHELAKARLDLARRIYRLTEEQITAPPTAPSAPHRISNTLEQLTLWSRRWMEAERDLAQDKAGRGAALSAHIQRLKKQEKICEELLRDSTFGLTQLCLDDLRYHRLEAEYGLAKEKA
jgi:hypothetical protein